MALARNSMFYIEELVVMLITPGVSGIIDTGETPYYDSTI